MLVFCCINVEAGLSLYTGNHNFVDRAGKIGFPSRTGFSSKSQGKAFLRKGQSPAVVTVVPLNSG